MSARPLLVGEAPPSTRHGAAPLDGVTATRLLALLNCSAGDPYAGLRRLFAPVNLCSSVWEPLEAKRTAPELNGQVRVLLGRRVAVACGHTAGWYEWWPLSPDVVAVAIPHPSGLNRTLNDPEHRRRAGEALKQAILQQALANERHGDLITDLMDVA